MRALEMHQKASTRAFVAFSEDKINSFKKENREGWRNIANLCEKSAHIVLERLLFRHPPAFDGFPGSIQQMQLVPVQLLHGLNRWNPLFPFEETRRSTVCLA